MSKTGRVLYHYLFKIKICVTNESGRAYKIAVLISGQYIIIKSFYYFKFYFHLSVLSAFPLRNAY